MGETNNMTLCSNYPVASRQSLSSRGRRKRAQKEETRRKHLEDSKSEWGARHTQVPLHGHREMGPQDSDRQFLTGLLRWMTEFWGLNEFMQQYLILNIKT